MRSSLSKCKGCGLYETSALTCKIFKTRLDPEEPGCPYFTKEILKCDSCGKTILNAREVLLEEFNGKTLCLCEECNAQALTCAFCSSGTLCDFETNPSTLPKVVQKQVRQGYTIVTTQVRNPDRVKETCAKNCKCWDPETQICRKEQHWCNNYDRQH